MAILTVYNFNQQVDFPLILSDSIKESLISIDLHHIDTVDSGPSMQIEIWFTDVLSEDDENILNSIIQNYVNSLPDREQKLNDIFNDMNFGMQLIAEFGAANRIANLSTGQVIQVAQQLAPIQALLMSGSIQTALTIIRTLTPNALITQQIIDYYVQQMQNYLNEE